jgi:hypothetical protein
VVSRSHYRVRRSEDFQRSHRSPVDSDRLRWNPGIRWLRRGTCSYTEIEPSPWSPLSRSSPLPPRASTCRIAAGSSVGQFWDSSLHRGIVATVVRQLARAGEEGKSQIAWQGLIVFRRRPGGQGGQVSTGNVIFLPRYNDPHLFDRLSIHDRYERNGMEVELQRLEEQAAQLRAWLGRSAARGPSRPPASADGEFSTAPSTHSCTNGLPLNLTTCHVPPNECCHQPFATRSPLRCTILAITDR